MLKKLLVLLFCSAILLVLVLFIQSPKEPAPSTTISLNRETLLQELNLYRQSKRLKPTVFDSRLCELSDKRVLEIQFKDNWSHAGFRNKSDPFFQKYPVYKRLGENLQKYTPAFVLSPKAVIMGWYKSPTHQLLIEDPDFNTACFSTYANVVVLILGQTN